MSRLTRVPFACRITSHRIGRRFVTPACAIVLGAMLLLMPMRGALAAAAARKPNIIFILTDDLGYGDIGAFIQKARQAANDPAKPFHMTPHLDRFAAEGMQLRDNYVAAPVCSSSRSSILTGVTQGHTRVRDNQFDWELADNYTLGSVMQRAGYTTAAFGKWGEQGQQDGRGGDLKVTDAHVWPAHPLKRGFDYYFGYMRHIDGHWHYPYEDHRQVWENYTNVADQLKLCYTTDLFTARCKKWIVDHEKTQAGKPFFIYLAYDTPHAKLQNPPCPFPKGGGLHGGLQWLGTPGHMINTAAGAVDSYTHPDYAHAMWDDDNDPKTPLRPWPDVYKRYATDVRRIDNAVGDLMQLLRDLHIDDNTLVVFSSDNGPSIESYLNGKDANGYRRNYSPVFFDSFGPFDGIKRDCWEGGVRMPTMAHWPGRIPAGSINATPCGSWDWMATFAAAAGQPAPERSDGVSLIPTLTRRGEQTASLIYGEYEVGGKTPNFQAFVPAHRGRKRGNMQFIRFGDYMGVRYDIKSAQDPFEIYNVTEDPQEAHNLAGQSEYDQMQRRMQAAAVNQRMPNASAKRPYDNEAVPAVTLHTQPGVQWRAYDGDWPWLPQFESMDPAASGSAESIALNADIARHNGVLFYGFINAPETGEYTFTLASDGPSFLRIHNCQVIDNDFKHQSGVPVTGKIKLAKGLHPFRLYYAHKPAAAPQLKLEWSAPGSNNSTPLSPDTLSHDAIHPNLIHRLDAQE